MGVAALPATVAAAELRPELELLDAAFAVPVAAAAAVAALVLARQARVRIERTLGRVGGARSALAGRILGVIGLCLASAGAIAVATFFVLSRYAE